MGELRILVKQTQLYNAQGSPVYYHAPNNNPYQMQVLPGQIPTNRQWPNYGNFTDVTEDVGNLQEISLSWSIDRDNYGVSVPGIFQIKKGTSGEISIENNLYRLIKQWLIDDVSASLNKVDIKIWDTGCNKFFEGYQLSNEDLRYCENEICEFNVNLRQEDAYLSCIRRTLITDNHQNWFPQDGKPSLPHPRFSYCNEIRPNSSLIATWILGIITFTITNLLLVTIIPIINSIILIINAVDAILGTGHVDYIDWSDIRDTQKESFVESAGCGREHPAPLIRAYIKNVCDKCGLKVDAVSAPIFFNPTQAVPFTSSGNQPQQNFHYNACYLHAPNKRGIRRVEQVNSPFRAPDFNNTDFWIPDNSPLDTLNEFLDKLKGIYNAEWRVTNGTLYFQRKDYWLNESYLFDFSKNGADRNKILQGLCFEWSQVKYPIYTKGLYQTDDSDKCGNEAKSFMNDIVSHGSKINNPNLEGSLDKEFPFGATRFRLDGITPDYIADAAQAAQVGINFIVGIFGGVRGIMDRISEVADYALLLNEETATLPKILLWNGESTLGARCVKLVSASPYTNEYMPVQNFAYNTNRTWDTKHPYNTFVKGQNGVLGQFPQGYYTVRNFVSTLIYQRPALLVNFPMYMDAEFEGTMWDLFHFIDDPARYPALKQNWSVKIDNCCANAELLGIYGDASGIQLGQKIKLPRDFYPDGRIKEITLVNDPENEYGSHIEIKGD